jgi:antitoxin component YwqK of YwqJK toxin-antitoxin module
MKTKSILTILLVTLTTFIFSQTNQLDANGKKDGKWTVYLDKDWKKVDDSTKAVYRRYTYFDHGTNIYPMGPCGGKGYKLEGDTKSKILNGEYKWYDGKGKLSSVHIFKDGEYVSCKEYFPTGELSQHFDYTKKCEGQTHGWTVLIYDKKGNLILTSPTCKDENGNWPKMRG